MNKGFTLLEIVLYLAFVSLVVITAIPFFVDVNAWQSEEKNVSNITRDFLFVEARIRDLVQNSTAILVPAPGEYSSRLVFDTENAGRFTVELGQLSAQSSEQVLTLESEENQTIDVLTATTTRITDLNFYQPNVGAPQRLFFNMKVQEINLGTTTYIFRDE